MADFSKNSKKVDWKVVNKIEEKLKRKNLKRPYERRKNSPVPERQTISSSRVD